MSDQRKSILLFIPESESNYELFIQNIDLNEWVITRANDFDNAKKEILGALYKIGLIFISNDQLGFLLDIKDLVSLNKCTNWIALTNKNMMLNPTIREMIVTYFYDYHQFPIDKTKLLAIIGHAYGMSELEHSIIKDYDERIQRKCMLIGKSDAMKNVRHQIVKLATVEKTVLITGESGTGKELVSRALHQLSNRAKGPLITVNTAALAVNLIQSELFGYEKGAFTGAHHAKKGKIEAANKGTIFLDEVGDIAPDIQVSLLRFLQEKTIERIGSADSIYLDVRVLSATHRNLEHAVANGSFREDLYYRLNTLRLELPPLRERGDDIIDLAYFMLDKTLKEQKKSKPKDFTVKALQVIKQHSWPGNIRELVNRIERAVLLCDYNLISPNDLDLQGRSNLRQVTTMEEARKRAEREAIRNAVQFTDGNLTKAAKILEISRASLYRIYNLSDSIITSNENKLKVVRKKE